MKVIGAGFTRTGTMSLKVALDELGIGPCLHPLAGGPGPESPERELHARDEVDWRAQLNLWGATTGWLGARHYRDLMDAWPEALVLLSVREPEAWYASYASCLRATRELALAGGPQLKAAETAVREALMIQDGPIWGGILDGSFAERDYALGRFHRHNREVASTVPANRLLVFDIQEGWEPLCDFLGVDVPDVPFPHVNTAAAFRSRFAACAPAALGRPGEPAAAAVHASVPDALADLEARLSPLVVAGQARISALAVSDTEASYSQREVLDMLGLSGDPFAEGIFRRCGVQRRNLGLAGPDLPATLQGRTAASEDQLFSHAVHAIDQLGVDLDDVGTVLSASLYSLGGPTLAHRLVEHYEMDPATDKYHVAGVGCASAVPLIRLLTQVLEAQPDRKALVVAAESMSGLLTQARPDDHRAKIVGSAIFADGCAAAVIERGDGAPGPAIVASTVHQIPGTLDVVHMELSEDDSYLHLARELPDLAAAGLRSLVDEFLAPLGLTRHAIDHWIVHPGGRRILECVQEALSLTDVQARISYEMLAAHGNVGTPSIFYVLKETIEQRRPAAGHRGLMVTVGPGVTVGLMLLVW